MSLKAESGSTRLTSPAGASFFVAVRTLKEQVLLRVGGNMFYMCSLLY